MRSSDEMNNKVVIDWVFNASHNSTPLPSPVGLVVDELHISGEISHEASVALCNVLKTQHIKAVFFGDIKILNGDWEQIKFAFPKSKTIKSIRYPEPITLRGNTENKNNQEQPEQVPDQLDTSITADHVLKMRAGKTITVRDRENKDVFIITPVDETLFPTQTQEATSSSVLIIPGPAQQQVPTDTREHNTLLHDNNKSSPSHPVRYANLFALGALSIGAIMLILANTWEANSHYGDAAIVIGFVCYAISEVFRVSNGYNPKQDSRSISTSSLVMLCMVVGGVAYVLSDAPDTVSTMSEKVYTSLYSLMGAAAIGSGAFHAKNIHANWKA